MIKRPGEMSEQNIKDHEGIYQSGKYSIGEQARFNYLTESERTASGKFHGKLVDFHKFLEVLTQFNVAANNLDRYKKLLFYGEDTNKQRFRDNNITNKDGYSITEAFSDDNDSEIKARYVLHAILGVMTEAGEMGEAIHAALTGQPGGVDDVNLLEESGDVKWYLAMLARALGNEWDADERRNIAKLRQRFPEKFTTEAANVRDLEAEREILEANPNKATTKVFENYEDHLTKNLPQRD